MGAASSSGTSSAASSLEWGSTCAAASLEAEPGWSPRAGGGVATSAVVVCTCEQRAGGRAREHRAGCSCGLCEGQDGRGGRRCGAAPSTAMPRARRAPAGQAQASAARVRRGNSRVVTAGRAPGSRARQQHYPSRCGHQPARTHTTDSHGTQPPPALHPASRARLAQRAARTPHPHRAGDAEGCRTFDLARRSRSNGLRRSRRSSGVTKSGAVPPPPRRVRLRKGGAQGPGPSWVC